MLDLFIILYLKCTKEIQLIFKHDINIILFNIITENSEQLINNGKFTRKVTFFYCQQYKQCMNDERDCDYKNLDKIKERIKRYEMKNRKDQ